MTFNVTVQGHNSSKQVNNPDGSVSWVNTSPLTYDEEITIVRFLTRELVRSLEAEGLVVSISTVNGNQVRAP